MLNNTVLTWDTTSQNLASSTSVLRTTIAESSDQELSDHKTYESETSRSEDDGRGGARSPGRYGAGNRRSNRVYNQPPKCQLCDEEHYMGKCLYFPNAALKRSKLEELDKCPDCGRIQHDDECQLNFKCRVCGKGYHLDFLCPCATQGNKS